MSNENKDMHEDKLMGRIIVGTTIAAVSIGLFISALLKVCWLNDQIDVLNNRIEILQSENSQAEETEATVQEQLIEKIAENAVLQNELDQEKAKNQELAEQIEVYEEALSEISEISNRINEGVQGITDAISAEE